MAISPTIQELTQELISIVKPLPEFEGRGFSVFDLDDLGTILQYESVPLVGISYEGRAPVTTEGTGRTTVSKTVTMVQATFSVLIAVRYATAAGVGDTKVDAVNLLNAVSSAVLGYKGVNHRGWAFNGESPLPSGIEGVIFYGQTWSVRLPIMGNFGT